MKTILVPIDFSEVSTNAFNYAAALAKLTESKLILLHVYHVPIPPSEAPFFVLSMDDLDKENMQALQKIDEHAKKTFGTLNTALIVRAGFVVDEIRSIIDEQHVDLVVMGVTGAGKSSGFFVGSNTTALMKKTKTSVLVIPGETSFKKAEKIVFACDHKETVPITIINKLKEIVHLFDAKVLVLDVIKPEENTSLEKAVAGVNLVHSLNDINHELYFPMAENVEEEINTFVEHHHADMLVMIPHSHKTLKELFHRSNTKKMAFHTSVPLLSIHD
jgi:nucleotide-binding universal stress UspA family protein